MKYDRRKFLELTGGAASGFALAGFAGESLLSIMQQDEKKKIKTFGLQLWSIKDDLPKDPKGVLKQVASYGYKTVESFEGKDGMFWGMSNLEFKIYMDELGMTIISSHCNISKDFEKKAADAAAIGMKYLVCPYKGPQKKLDDFKAFADEFNKCGEICRKNGIRFAYHNHDYSFVELEGQLPQNVMMTNTDANLVDFEMDIYWVVTAGQDPVKWFQKYPGRFKLCHIKDRMKNATEHSASCILGTGSIDFPPILKEGKKEGLEYYIVEHERYDDGTPMHCAEADAAYMKTVKI
jgi:sugar phosphate isomerase/epimerase